MSGNDRISSPHGSSGATLAECTQRVRYYAYFTNADAAEGKDDELEVPVESWDADGRALVLVPEEGRLVAATDRPGFLRVERYEVPQVRGVLPGGGGRERCPDHPARYRRGCLECAMAVPD